MTSITPPCYKSVEQQLPFLESYQRQTMMTTNEQDLIYPVVAILVDRIKCRALLDTRLESSNISLELAKRLEEKPLRTNYKQVETIFHKLSHI